MLSLASRAQTISGSSEEVNQGMIEVQGLLNTNNRYFCVQYTFLDAAWKWLHAPNLKNEPVPNCGWRRSYILERRGPLLPPATPGGKICIRTGIFKLSALIPRIHLDPPSSGSSSSDN
ncbi:hypothetical protein TNCV_1181591 [Trichonephila clavipes]|nr:hypothetical protein TNCV_1181591 [Trichonephila clavipes]